MIRELLIREIRENTDRVLALLNRNPLDELCGSFDREYWAWNFKDYANMSLQAGIYLLALLWDTDFAGNRFYKNSALLRSIRKALLFWCRYQKKNGSFDQCYYNEQSYGTTSYTLLAVLNTLSILEKELPGDERTSIHASIDRASDFLLRHSERYGAIANHQAQFMCVMLAINHNQSNPASLRLYAELKHLVAALQSVEGWFKEYDGMDAGYLSQTIYYLARCHEITGDESLLPRLDKAVQFFSHFIHPDGSCGGIYGSRYNENFYPCGFALLRKRSPVAARLLEYCLKVENPGVRLCALDPENLIRVMTNYLEALRCGPFDVATDEERLPCEQSYTDVFFREAGIHIKGNSRYYAVISFKRGGCMSVYDKNAREPLFIDPSYAVELADGDRITNGVRQDAEYRVTGHGAVLKSRFTRVRIPEYTAVKGFILRLMAFTVLRPLVVNDWFKKMLVRMLITGEEFVPGSLERSIVFFDDHIEIRDEISVQGELVIRKILEDPDIRTRKMASVGYRYYAGKMESRIERQNRKSAVIYRLISCRASDEQIH